jgi:hypothetical protein
MTTTTTITEYKLQCYKILSILVVQTITVPTKQYFFKKGDRGTAFTTAPGQRGTCILSAVLMNEIISSSVGRDRCSVRGALPWGSTCHWQSANNGSSISGRVCRLVTRSPTCWQAPRTQCMSVLSEVRCYTGLQTSALECVKCVNGCNV